jgi:hypothetical protein
VAISLLERIIPSMGSPNNMIVSKKNLKIVFFISLNPGIYDQSFISAISKNPRCWDGDL